MNDQNPPSDITGDNGCYHSVTNESDEPIIILVEEISAFIQRKTGKAFAMTRNRADQPGYPV